MIKHEGKQRINERIKEESKTKASLHKTERNLCFGKYSIYFKIRCYKDRLKTVRIKEESKTKAPLHKTERNLCFRKYSIYFKIRCYKDRLKTVGIVL